MKEIVPLVIVLGVEMVQQVRNETIDRSWFGVMDEYGVQNMDDQPRALIVE